MLIIDIIRHTLRGLVTAVAAVTVIAGAVLLLLMAYVLRMVGGNHGVKAPKAVNLASFTQQFRKNSANSAEEDEIPYKIDKN